jgi:integrase/recombinase XerD
MSAVNITKRVNTPEGKRYCRVVFSGNGRIKPDYVLIRGNEERHPEGAYYIEWREGKKRCRESVGKHAADAFARKLRKQQVLTSKAMGIKVDEGHADARRSISDAVSAYLDRLRISVWWRYRVSDQFSGLCHGSKCTDKFAGGNCDRLGKRQRTRSQSFTERCEFYADEQPEL